MSAFDDFIIWFAGNIHFHVLILLVLFAWDVIDLYIERGDFRFIRKKTYAVYYFVRAFFAITLMEITLALGLLNIGSRVILSFVTPLIFAALLQNLLFKIGGDEGAQLDVSKIFSTFREKILSSLNEGAVLVKLKESKRLIDSKISNEEIQKECQVYAQEREEFEKLREIVKDFPQHDQRIEWSRQLIEWGTKDAVDDLLKKHHSRKIPPSNPSR